ncbi:MAG TPA: iron-regulated protein [Microscillaceae bacterium]|nr:iron-regulated protein [Microscillaceae bacterium]
MRFTHIISGLIITALVAFAPAKQAYQLFDKAGKKTTYEKMLADLQNADVVLFGELHNNPISHWLQLEVTKDLHKTKKQNLLLGAEMFEADNQVVLSEYLQKTISRKNFEADARLWPNYKTDYRPLVALARQNQLTFVATNVPRRYASLVSRQGVEALEKLSPEAKKWMAPLPFKIDLTLPGYANMIKMMGGMHGGGHGSMRMKPENFAKAQALKDATMAHFILKNLKKDQTLVHYNGTYHSNNFEGIGWYLKQKRKKLKIVTIASVSQKNIDELSKKNQQLADYTLVIPNSMTKTY